MRSRLAALWLRTQAWLRREAYVREAVMAAAQRAYVEGHKEGSAEGYRAGYQVGHAYGELMGRENLALELEVAHGVRPMTPGDVENLKVRQVH